MNTPRDHITELAADADLLRQQVPEGVLLPYQQRWIADASPVKIAEKSRRVGLTWAEAADAALYAAQASGANVYYLAYNLDMTRRFAEDVAWWASWYDLATQGIEEETVLAEGDDAVQVFRVRFASGHSVECLPSRPRSLRSKGAPGERVVLDEFAFHDDQEELLKSAMAFLIWGGSVRIISTHNGAENGFAALIEECRGGRKPYAVHRIPFAEALSEGLYRRICLLARRSWTTEGERKWEADVRAQYGDGASEELDCVPARSEGRYLARILVEDAMRREIPVLRWRWEAEWTFWDDARQRREIDAWCQEHLAEILRGADPGLASSAGVDFGRRGDLTVVIPAQTGRDLVRKSLFALELRGVPHEAQAMILSWTFDRLTRLRCVAMDATGPGSYLAETIARRYSPARIHQVMLSRAWYLEWFPRYRAALEDRKIELPLDADILDDHSDVRLVGGVPRVPDAARRTSGAGKHRGQRHGDAAIAAVLAWYASEQAPVEIDYVSSGEQLRSARAYGSALPSAAGSRMNIGWGAVGRTSVTAGYRL